MSLRSLFASPFSGGSKAGVVGNALRNVDFGLSERNPDIYSGLAQLKSNIFGNTANAMVMERLTPQQQQASQGTTQPRNQAPSTIVPQNPAGFAPTGSSGPAPSGGNQFLGGSPAETTTPSPAYQETTDNLDREFATISSRASNIFGGLRSTASSQLDRLGGEQSDLEGRVNSGSNAARGVVDTQLQAANNALGQSENTLREGTQKSLRGLAEDQRNTTTSISRQLGARGAGDTSAGDYAGAAIGRQGLKQRGNTLEQQDITLREIGGRRADAQNIAMQEYSRIEQGKQQQLASIASNYQDLRRQLENAKATADSSEQRYIADQESNLEKELRDTLSKLDSDARDRKTGLEDWFTKQDRQLQDSLALLQGKATIDLNDPLSRINAFSQLASGNTQINPQAANDYLQTQFSGVPTDLYRDKPEDEDIFAGLLTPEEKAAAGL